MRIQAACRSPMLIFSGPSSELSELAEDAYSNQKLYT